MIKKKMLLIIIILNVLSFFIYIKYNRMIKPDKEVIILFNWGEYIDPKIIDKYNQQSNRFIVKSSFFSSNELAINKIKAGNKYDIAILSEYAIEQLRDDYLENIRFDEIKESTTKTQEFQKLMNKYSIIDPKYNKVSIPYFWGKLGFLYNKKKINANEIIQWRKLLYNPTYKVALYNNSFEGIFLGLKAINADISGDNEIDINKSKEWLLKLKKKNFNLSFITDQLLDSMRIQDEERYDIALSYSGDARFLMKQNSNLEYYDFDKESNSDSKGTNIWVDSFVLPKGSNQEGAYDFINFLLRKKNILKNIDFTCYDSPYYEFWEKKNSKLILSINNEDTFYKYNENCKKQINNAWNFIYSYPRPRDNYLFILSFFILLFFLFLKIRFTKFNIKKIKKI
jgi:spermidine/putrescine transport system substrate-binding protein